MLSYTSDILPQIQASIEDDSDETAVKILHWTNLSLDRLSKSHLWRQLRKSVDTLVSGGGSDTTGLIEVPTDLLTLHALYPVASGWTKLYYVFYQAVGLRSVEANPREKYFWIPAGMNEAQTALQMYLYQPDGSVYNGDVLWDYQIRHPAVAVGQDNIFIDCLQTLTLLILQWALRNSKYDIDAKQLEGDIQQAMRIELSGASQGPAELTPPGMTVTSPGLFSLHAARGSAQSVWGGDTDS